MDKTSTQDILKEALQLTMSAIGEDPNREGLLDTPKRIIKSWKEIYAGYNMVAEEIITTFDETDQEYNQIILLKDIEMFSMCEHHMLPFFGKAHVAYIPNKKIVGISKLARLLEMYARRMQIQERIGEQVTDILMELLDPKGAACVIEASHMCMRMRGANKQNSTMITSSLKGCFLQEGDDSKNELFQLIKG